MKKFLSLLLVLWLPQFLAAAQRSEEQLSKTARQILAKPSLRLQAKAKSQPLTILQQSGGITVMGYEQSGFVVLANDDNLPEVLGYSASPFATAAGNANMQWWLAMVGEAAASGVRHEPIKPDTDKYPPSREPMVEAQWGQELPYGLFCPLAKNQRTGATEHTLTGCVAVAMSQVIHHYRYPQRGEGHHTIYYPIGDPDGQALTAEFGATVYDYDNMLAVYKDADYTDAQATAVAQLMLHCGIACDMQYDLNFSGAYMTKAAIGMKRYFGYATESIRSIVRRDFTDDVWMDMVYNELSHDRPLLYGGDDASYGGHCFVIDGYDADGMVHVNWGWEGKDDGYYDISILKTTNYKFSEGQEMVIGISPGPTFEPVKASVAITEAGSLAERLGGEKRLGVTELTVSGPLNSTDILTIRQMCGRNSDNTGTRGMLYRLDMAGATIVAGGEPYLDYDGEKLTTTANKLTKKMFLNCEGLGEVTLPAAVTDIEPGLFAGCRNLEEVSLPDAPAGVNRSFTLDSQGLVMTKNGKEVMAVLPFPKDTIVVPEGVERLQDYAFYGDAAHENIVLPASLQRIGSHGMDNSSWHNIKIYAKTPPRLGTDAFGSGAARDEMVYYCKLFVPAGARQTYLGTAQWTKFKGTWYYMGGGYVYDNIIEFGTVIKARNCTKTYGEDNPEMGFTILGQPIDGMPEIICEATKQSPVGRYDIRVARGTITNEELELQNGYIVVMQAPLTAIADDVYMEEGSQLPEFTASYEGLLFDDTADAVEEKPLITTTATAASAIGDYPLTISGGKSTNYSITGYRNGTLHIVEKGTLAINTANATGMPTQPTYNLLGRPANSQTKGIVVGRKKLMFNSR